MVLAAGLGTRMQPLTFELAKPALPVLNRPLICWTLDLLARHGIDEVIVNLHHLPQSVRQAIGNGKRRGLTVRYSYEPTILGTAGGPKRARRWLGSEPVLLINGDILCNLDLSRLIAYHRQQGALATLALRPNPDPRRYLPVRTNAVGRVVSLPGARTAQRGRPWLFAGVQVMEPRLLDGLAEGPRDSIRDLYAPLVDARGPIFGLVLRGAWLDMGTPELYRRGQLTALTRGMAGLPCGGRLVDPRARVGAGARVTRSVVAAGAVIGAGARVHGSVVWKGARIGAAAIVRDAVLGSHARVPAGARVRGGAVMAGGAARS